MGIQGESWIRRHQVTVEQYYRMAEVGLLTPEDRVELIEGEVIDMAPMGSRHASMVRKLTERFYVSCGEHVTVSVQSPIRLGEISEPEPDIAILARREDSYAPAHPSAADVWLLVEVAETSLRYDKEVKLPLYAKHHIPEVWIVDTGKKSLSIYRQPEGDRYRDEQTTTAPSRLSLAAMPGVAVDVSGLFS
jgi:Uma2 family endonuclease